MRRGPQPVVAPERVDEQRARGRRARRRRARAIRPVWRRGAKRMPYAYSDAYGTHATQSPAVVDDALRSATSRSTSTHTAQRRRSRDLALRVRAPAERTGTRRSGRADGRSSRRPRGRGSRTRARTRPRAGRAAPRCARPTGRRPCAPAATGSVASDCVCSGEKSTTSHAPTAGRRVVPAAAAPIEVDRGARARARASGSGTSARRTARVPRARRRRTGSRSSGRFGRAWRWPTMLTHSRVSGSKRSSPSLPSAAQRRG